MRTSLMINSSLKKNKLYFKSFCQPTKLSSKLMKKRKRQLFKRFWMFIKETKLVDQHFMLKFKQLYDEVLMLDHKHKRNI